MPLPHPRDLFAARVFVQIRWCARLAHDEQIDPAVAVEVIRPREEAVRVALRWLGFGRVEFVVLIEVRSCIPVRSVDQVHLTVAVEIRRVGTFRVVDLGWLLNVEGSQFVGLCEKSGFSGENKRQQGCERWAHGGSVGLAMTRVENSLIRSAGYFCNPRAARKATRSRSSARVMARVRPSGMRVPASLRSARSLLARRSSLPVAASRRTSSVSDSRSL